MDTTTTYTKLCPIKGHWINVPEGTPGARKLVIRNNAPFRTSRGTPMLDPLADYQPAVSMAAPTGSNIIPFKRRT